mmetsp:Transcript_14420/g.42962  ORF Transcript_14420/g.42962 Transcript_14420/m.42962 type:complete len:209 (-) Transcript_14420:244-870(-)
MRPTRRTAARRSRRWTRPRRQLAVEVLSSRPATFMACAPSGTPSADPCSRQLILDSLFVMWLMDLVDWSRWPETVEIASWSTHGSRGTSKFWHHRRGSVGQPGLPGGRGDGASSPQLGRARTAVLHSTAVRLLGRRHRSSCGASLGALPWRICSGAQPSLSCCVAPARMAASRFGNSRRTLYAVPRRHQVRVSLGSPKATTRFAQPSR